LKRLRLLWSQAVSSAIPPVIMIHRVIKTLALLFGAELCHSEIDGIYIRSVC
jgi:hypothetical protein